MYFSYALSASVVFGIACLSVVRTMGSTISFIIGIMRYLGAYRGVEMSYTYSNSLHKHIPYLVLVDI
jgi:hypothetical protein